MSPRGLKRTEGNPGIILTHIKIQCYSWLKNWTNDSIQEINRWPQHLFFSVQTKISLFLLWPQQTLRICLLRQVCTAVGIRKKKNSGVQPFNRLQPVSIWQLATLLIAQQGQLETKASSWELRTQPGGLQAWGERGLQVRSWPSWDGGGVGGMEKEGWGAREDLVNSCRSLGSTWAFRRPTVHGQ